MIVFSRALILNPAAAAADLFLPRIGYQTWLRGLTDAAVTASGALTDAPKDAPLRPDTAEYWEPPSLPATWLVDLGASRQVDYVGIAAHNLGSKSAAVQVEFSPDASMPAPHISFPGASANYASTPDSAAVDVTGDLDVRVRVALDDWTPAADQDVVSKYHATGNQRSWLLRVTTAGLLQLVCSLDGSATTGTASSVAPTVSDGAALWIRATRASASGNINYYTSPDYNPATGAGTWNLLGAANRASTAGALFNSSAQLTASGNSAGTVNPLKGKFFYCQLYSGIAGVLKASLNPADAPDGYTSITSSATGEVWTVNTSGGPGSRLNNYNFAEAIAPADDAALLFMDVTRTARYLKLTVTGSSATRIASVYAGQLLAMERGLALGFRPPTLSRQTTLKNAMSKGGQLLGSTVRKHGLQTEASFSHLTQSWYRAYFDPFVKSARQYPYFFAWNPQDFPLEVGYMWSDSDIAPQYATIDRFDVSWKMVGIGNE